MMRRLLIAASVLFAAGVVGTMAPATIILSIPCISTVFDNAGQPWPFFGVTPSIAYDQGGNGVAYVATAGGACAADGSAYRSDYINFKIDAASPGGFRLGCFSAGQSYNTKIVISGAGPYVVNLVAANGGGSATTISVLIDSVPITTIGIAQTADYNTFQTFQSGQFSATQTTHSLTIACTTGDTTFNSCGDMRSWQGAVSGVGIACDIGPTFTGSIPAGAQLAGFTHCIANYDFASTSSFTYAGNTYNFSNISTWLGAGCGASAPLWWNNGYNSHATPCSRYSIVSDGGTNVLHMIYTAADAAAGAEMTWMQSFDGSNPSPSTGNFFFPQGMYTESTWRSTLATFSAYTGKDILSYFAWNNSPEAQNGKLMEWDVVEAFSDGVSGGGCVDWSAGPTFPCLDSDKYMLTVGNPSFYTSYHTYGQLVTSNGSQVKKCHYVDGVQGYRDGVAGPCSSAITPGLSSVLTLHNYYQIGVGNQNDTSFPAPASQLDMYIRSITFWGCTNWQTQQCNTALVP